MTDCRPPSSGSTGDPQREQSGGPQDGMKGLVERHLAEREADMVALRQVIQDAEAAGLFDRAIKRVASRLDPTDTDEGLERWQTILTAGHLDGMARAATYHGWEPGR